MIEHGVRAIIGVQVVIANPAAGRPGKGGVGTAYLLMGSVIVLLVASFLKLLRPAVQSPLADQSQSNVVYDRSATGESERAAIASDQQVRALMPTCEQMVDSAIMVLSQGLRGMNEQEQEVLLRLYDPAATGEVDEAFLRSMLVNYKRIRQALNKDVAIIYEADHDLCQGQRLYFTDLMSLHVCPNFFEETDDMRKARTLIHEFAHSALQVRDRPYYRPTSKAFAQLSPRGPWITQLPLIGPIVREIVASDTLYHPDTYAHFAVAMSGQPGALDPYLDQEATLTIAPDNSKIADYQITDSWHRQSADSEAAVGGFEQGNASVVHSEDPPSNNSFEDPIVSDAKRRIMIEEQILASTVRIVIQNWHVDCDESGYTIDQSVGHATVMRGGMLVTHNHFSLPLSIRQPNAATEAWGLVKLLDANGRQLLQAPLSDFEIAWEDQETLVFAYADANQFEVLGLRPAEFMAWTKVPLEAGMEVAQVDWDGRTTRVDWTTVKEVILDDGAPMLVLEDGVTVGASGGGIFWQGKHIANNCHLRQMVDASENILGAVTTVALDSDQVSAISDGLLH